MRKICIIGGMNFSVISKVSEELQEDTSICGNIQTRFGGVALNLASVISEHKDFQVDFITILSKDLIGKAAEETLEARGISFGNSLYLDKWQSYYSDICSKNFHYGINDMKIVDMIDTSFINIRKKEIEKNDILIIDENLSKEVLEYIVDYISIPVYCEATSPIKCKRIIERISKIYAIKFNSKEFCAFYGVTPDTLTNDDMLLRTIKDHCAKLTFVTLGEKGSLCISNGEIYRYCSENMINAVNTLQAGDGFFGSGIVKMLSGEDILAVLKYATLYAERILIENKKEDKILTD